MIAAHHDARCTVVLGEVRLRPNGVALHLVLVGKRKEVECPSIAMQRLSGLAGTDGDRLREVELEVRRVRQDQARRTEGQRVHDEFPARRGTSDESARSPGRLPAEVIRAGGGADQPRSQLFGDSVHEPGRSQVVDDDGALRLDRFSHRLWLSRGWKMRYGHRRPSVIAPSP